LVFFPVESFTGAVVGRASSVNGLSKANKSVSSWVIGAGRNRPFSSVWNWYPAYLTKHNHIKTLNTSGFLTMSKWLVVLPLSLAIRLNCQEVFLTNRKLVLRHGTSWFLRWDFNIWSQHQLWWNLFVFL